MRQQGEDDISSRFRVALGELQASQLSKQSWEPTCLGAVTFESITAPYYRRRY
jgi:hypothetical protein